MFSSPQTAATPFELRCSIQQFLKNELLLDKKFDLTSLQEQNKKYSTLFDSILMSKSIAKLKKYSDELLFLIVKCAINIINECHAQESMQQLFGFLQKLTMASFILNQLEPNKENKNKFYAFIAALIAWQMNGEMGIHFLNHTSTTISEKFFHDSVLLINLELTRAHLSKHPSDENYLLYRCAVLQALKEFYLTKLALSELTNTTREKFTSHQVIETSLKSCLEQAVALSSIKEKNMAQFSKLIELYISAGQYKEAKKYIKQVEKTIPTTLEKKFKIFSAYMHYKMGGLDDAQRKLELVNETDFINLYLKHFQISNKEIHEQVVLLYQKAGCACEPYLGQASALTPLKWLGTVFNEFTLPIEFIPVPKLPVKPAVAPQDTLAHIVYQLKNVC